MPMIRLDKFLADSGQGSRTQVRQLIKRGCVTVNTMTVKTADYKVDTDKDCICVDGKKLLYEEVQYYMLNKPAGVVSATRDNCDRTVIDIINENKRRDLFPVGRLDKDTEGLLIITNDGRMANNILSPSRHISKEYYAVVDGVISEEHIESFANGIDIGDSKPTMPALLNCIITYEENGETRSRVLVTIMEGRYHQIKRMFGAFGMKVLYLKRISMGGVRLDDTLQCGQYRRLTDSEIRTLVGEGDTDE